MSKQPRAVYVSDLQDVLRDVEDLQAWGYQRLGQWSLGQVCSHLSMLIHCFLDGFPQQPMFSRVPLWLCRNTIARFPAGRSMMINILTGSVRTFPQLVPSTQTDDDAAAADLRQAIRRLQDHPGPFQPSPALGRLEPTELMRLQLVHCAHHLGFLTPSPEDSGSAETRRPTS